MKLLGVLLSSVLCVASMLALERPAAAETSQYNNQIRVYGVVLPKHHVIVDEWDNITEIISNTEKDVAPTVYINKISDENMRTLTPEIYQQYRQLVPAGSSKIGTLYKRHIGINELNPVRSLTETKIDTYALPRFIFGE